ncbi:MAG: hypothetical protein ABSA46_09190 [Thermodesulfovibrionales bacterium]|jgi:hypothetical protein
MKKNIFFLILAVLVMFAVIQASPLPVCAARVYFSGGVWVGPGWGWGPWWGPAYYPYGYGPYYPYSVVARPQVYVQSTQQPEEQHHYWYFCTDPQGYYPYITQCPKGWLKVIPSSAAPDQGR